MHFVPAIKPALLYNIAFIWAHAGNVCAHPVWYRRVNVANCSNSSLCVFLCERWWKLHGLVLGAGVWEDVRGNACQSALNPCNLSLSGPPTWATLLHRISVYPSPCFPAKDFARAHYCIRSLLQKISERPGAKDTIWAFTLLLNRLTLKEIKKNTLYNRA